MRRARLILSGLFCASAAVLARRVWRPRYRAQVLDEWGDLKRVIAGARSAEIGPGGRIVVTAVEIWDAGMVVHATELRPEYSPPGEPIPATQSSWRLFDDVGTIYPGRGGSASGSQSHVFCTHAFAGTPPTSAKSLSVVAPGMSDDQPIIVSLT